jgi:hypothetical protein
MFEIIANATIDGDERDAEQRRRARTPRPSSMPGVSCNKVLVQDDQARDSAARAGRRKALEEEVVLLLRARGPRR